MAGVDGDAGGSRTAPDTTYAVVARKATCGGPSSWEKASAPLDTALVPGKGPLGPGGAVGAGLPKIAAFGEDGGQAGPEQVRNDSVAMVKLLIDGMSYDEKCRVLGVAPLFSGHCVTTAAGPGGVIVPTGGRALGVSVTTFRSSSYLEDETLARRLQDEENALAAGDSGIAARDAANAATLAVEPRDAVTPDPSAASPDPSFRPGEWGTRFAALSLDDRSDLSAAHPRVDVQVSEPDEGTDAEQAFRRAELEVIAQGRKGNAAAKRRTAAPRAVDDTREAHEAAKAALARARKERERALKAKEAEVTRRKLKFTSGVGPSRERKRLCRTRMSKLPKLTRSGSPAAASANRIARR